MNEDKKVSIYCDVCEDYISGSQEEIDNLTCEYLDCPVASGLSNNDNVEELDFNE